jgi:hypothetical protein
MNLRVMTLAVVGVASLAGCGGGGSSAPDGTPVTPTPVPAPVPTPNPGPLMNGPDPTLLNLVADTDLPGYSGVNDYFRAPDGRVTYVSTTHAAYTVPARFQASTRSLTYNIFAEQIPQSGSTNSISLTRDESASTDAYVVSTGQSQDVSYKFTQLRVGSSNTLLPLFYSTVAISEAKVFDAVQGVTRYGISPLAFGVQFEWERTLLSGSANYRGVVLGNARGVGTRVYQVTGTVEIAANYDTKVFSGTLRLSGKDDVTGKDFDLGTIDLVPQNPRPVLDYIYFTTGATSIQANFKGEKAQEIAGVYEGDIADPQTPGASLRVVAGIALKK